MSSLDGFNEYQKDERLLTSESNRIVERLELKERQYLKTIHQLQQENMLLNDKVTDLESESKRLRDSKILIHRELEMMKHKTKLLENELDSIEILQSPSTKAEPVFNPFRNSEDKEQDYDSINQIKGGAITRPTPTHPNSAQLNKLKQHLSEVKQQINLETKSKESLIVENTQLREQLEAEKLKTSKAEKILAEFDELEKTLDQFNIEFKQTDIVLKAFFSDLSEVILIQKLNKDIITPSFKSLTEDMNKPEGSHRISFGIQQLQPLLLSLLNQIEFGISTGLKLKKQLLFHSKDSDVNQSERISMAQQLSVLEETLEKQSLEFNALKKNYDHLKKESKAEETRQINEKTKVIQKLIAEKSDIEFNLKAENEKLYKENKFIDEMLSKLVNLMPNQDMQDLLKSIIERAKEVLTGEKERVYIESLLEVNEKELKKIIQQDSGVEDQEICLLRKNVEAFRETLRNCQEQKSMRVNDLSSLLSQLDRAAIIQTHRLTAIRSTEKEEIINQAYVELLEKELQDQSQREQQIPTQQNEEYDVIYKSIRSDPTRATKQRNPFLKKHQTQLNESISELDEQPSALMTDLQNSTSNLKQILAGNVSHRAKSLLYEQRQPHTDESSQEIPDQKEINDQSLLQKHMLLKRDRILLRNENPLLELDKSQEDYFSKLDYSKSNASEFFNATREFSANHQLR